MADRFETVIVSATPIHREALQRLCEEADRRFRCHGLESAEAELSTGADPGIVVMAPSDWQEMVRWQPELERRFGAQASLLFGELRLGGMFAGALEARLSTIVGSGSTSEEFRAALMSLAEGVSLCTPAALLTRFNQGARQVTGGSARELNAAELQCACAISFGLTYAQIAEHLSMSDGTVKRNIHNALHKLGVSSGPEMGLLVEKALSPHPETFRPK